MKVPLLLCILFIQAYQSLAQSIPEFKGETIDNKTVNIPGDLKGKYTLLCFASSQKAQTDLESWMDPVYQKYIAKTGIMDDMYDVNVFFIPILTGANASFASSMKKKFRETAQKDLRPHVLFCSENSKDILNLLNMQKSNVPYFFLLNQDAKIIYRTSGVFTDEKFDAIDDLIE